MKWLMEIAATLLIMAAVASANGMFDQKYPELDQETVLQMQKGTVVNPPSKHPPDVKNKAIQPPAPGQKLKPAPGGYPVRPNPDKSAPNPWIAITKDEFIREHKIDVQKNPNWKRQYKVKFREDGE